MKIPAYLYLSLLGISSLSAQTIGEALPSWTQGTLDIHEISTGRGSSTFFVLPDGTTMLYDAGEFTETNQAWRVPRYIDAKPDTTRPAGEWITKYISRILESVPNRQIDYGLISHFHWDHMGQITSRSPMSSSGAYRLSGLTTVAESIPIKAMFDRDWPNYDYPTAQADVTKSNYQAFLEWQSANNDMHVGKFEPGSNAQVVLKNEPGDYPDFEVRSIAVNGEVWTGVGENKRAYFPPLESLEQEDFPTENMCSMALRLSYGKFDYFTGGDMRGIPPDGSPDWFDLETPIAQAVGPVEASQLNHHGYIDSQNPFFVKTLRPLVWLLSSWDSAHPSPMVYKRLLSEKLYPGPRDIFATGMHEANKLVLVGADRMASSQGHIVLRVAPGGETFRVFVLDDSVENGKITSIHGPYTCR